MINLIQDQNLEKTEHSNLLRYKKKEPITGEYFNNRKTKNLF